MYCIRCGKELEDGTKFCIFCGTPTVEAKEEQPRPAEDDTVSIPIDFFSSRMAQNDSDDFAIAIPEDFIPADTAPQEQKPDEIEDIGFTRMLAKEDILAAMREQVDEAGDMDYTRAVAKEDIRAAIQQQEQQEVPPVDVSDIPDIPIPSDFIEDDIQSEDTVEESFEDDDEPEQLMTRRGILSVVIVVVLLFTIAVGACVTVLRGHTAPAGDAGSGSAEIGFWSAGEPE